MKKFVKFTYVPAICLILLLVSGCDDAPQKAGTANSGAWEFQKICVDGVEYLFRERGYGAIFAAHFKPDGSLYTCGN